MVEEYELELRIPGPTPLPESVRQAESKQMISHRSPEFADLLAETCSKLRPLFGTDGDIFVLTTSGTGGMEACVANTVSPDDKVLVVSIGVFGDRFAAIAKAYGAEVVNLEFPLGQVADAQTVARTLDAHPDCRVVFVTHNETSTGATNDLAAIGAAIQERGPDRPLLVVDAVSSLGGIEFKMDEWGCDLVLTASQKACMTPPGLAMIAVSQRAWPQIEAARSPRFYFDLRMARRYAERDNTPFTPAVSALYGLDRALDMIAEEGLDAVYTRHERLAVMLRDGLRQLGLLPLADEAHASNTITAVYVPQDHDGAAIVQQLAQTYNLHVGGGQGALKGKVFRIAHMGWVDEDDIQRVLQVLEDLFEERDLLEGVTP